ENSSALPSRNAAETNDLCGRDAPGTVRQGLAAAPGGVGVVVTPIAAVEGAAGQGETPSQNGMIIAERRKTARLEDHQSAVRPDQPLVGCVNGNRASSFDVR